MTRGPRAPFHTMAYSEKTIEMVARAPRTLGTRLGRWAIHLDFPVTKVSRCTGATRQTVYNWFAGGDMLAAYHDRVSALIKILESSPTAEEAWRKACKQFNIQG